MLKRIIKLNLRERIHNIMEIYHCIKKKDVLTSHSDVLVQQKIEIKRAKEDDNISWKNDRTLIFVPDEICNSHRGRKPDENEERTFVNSHQPVPTAGSGTLASSEQAFALDISDSGLTTSCTRSRNNTFLKYTNSFENQCLN